MEDTMLNPFDKDVETMWPYLVAGFSVGFIAGVTALIIVALTTAKKDKKDEEKNNVQI